jgi:MtrB/PioB family decaheme-associated outer membrane protein
VLSAQYYLSLPLDSQSHELFLNGGYNFTPTTRGTFKLSYSQATQDENLSTPPNPALVDSRAPTHLDGRLDTTLVELGLTSRPMRELSIVANLRYRDFADKTPTQQYVYTGTAMWNTPFSYTNKLGKLEATYLLPQAFSLLGGIEYQTQDRTAPTVGEIVVPFARKLDEASYRVQLRKSMSETVTGSLSYLYQERDGSDYVSSPKAFENLIHPMNIADRQRDKLRAMLDWSPMQQLNLQFAIDDNRDKYNDGGPGSLGLQDGTSQLYSVDASYQVSSGWQVHAWVSRDESEANEITNRDVVGGIDTGNRKYNTLRETGTSFGAGVKGKVSGRLKVGGNVEQFRSVNEYEQTLVGGSTLASLGLVPTPDITNKLLRVKLYAKYAVEKNAELGLNVIRELWRTDDWSWNMFPASGGTTPFEYCGTACTTTGSDGTTVTAKPAQNSTFIGIRYIYRF